MLHSLNVQNVSGNDRILVCLGRGGLANRLKPLSSCYGLAKRVGRRLVVDWSVDNHCGASFADLYQNEIHHCVLDALLDEKSVSIYADARVIAGWNEPDLVEKIRKIGVKPLEKVHVIDRDRAKAIVVYASDYLPNSSPVECREFFSLLTNTREIESRLEEARARLSLSKEFVGVHARGSDFGGSVDWYLGEMHKFHQKCPARRFFVCSDSADYEARLLESFPGTLVNAKSAYVSKIESSTDWSSDNINRSLESVKDAVVDMHLLASTDFQIYNPYSTFAHVVGMLSTGALERLPKSPGILRRALGRIKSKLNWRALICGSAAPG